jgi:hypothetical protein
MVRLSAPILVCPVMKASGPAAVLSRAARRGQAGRGQTAFSILCWLKITNFDHSFHRVSDVTVLLLSHIHFPLLIVWASFCCSVLPIMYCVKSLHPLHEKLGCF